MARLNDPPAPTTESIDALKRRFIRQNREIARVNSTQSQRIRNLESEISRLLAENVAIRQEAIAAAAEAEKWRAAGRLGKEVSELKTKLEGKLSEVNALVGELGGLPEKVARRSSMLRRRSGLGSSDKEQRVRPLSNGDAEGQDGRLPAILEDKYYPRRTLENEELRLLTVMVNSKNDDTESPDLGPPPVAHFETPDPIAFDSSKSPKRVSGGMITTTDDDLAVLSRNLETRRKRRTSSLVHEMPNLQGDEEIEAENAVRAVSLPNASAKRKFDASEVDNRAIQVPHNDDFVFQRRDADKPRPSRFSMRPVDRQQQTDSTQASTASQLTTEQRKILAPKSTNSPSKKTMTTSTLVKGSDSTNDDTSAVHRSTTRRTATRNPVSIDTVNLNAFDVETNELQHAPKTPAANFEDMISPPSSALDTQPKVKSTEAAIINSVEDVLNGSIGRGSRRARAAVSYAEPNLRDKMRRPDKKLVGAVEGLNKSGGAADREASVEATKEKSNEPAQSADPVRVVRIKSDKKPGTEVDTRWTDLPEVESKGEVVSPSKDRERPITTRAIEIRKKRTHSESEGIKTAPKPVRHAIDGDEESLDKAVSRLSIFDPPTSSPISPRPKQESRPGSTSRKTGTIQASSSTTCSTTNLRDRDRDRDPATVERPSTATSRTTRRYSSQQTTSNPLSHHPITDRGLSRSNSAMSMRDTAAGKENLNHQLSTTKLKRAGSVQTLNVGAGDGKSIGTRRRSMMV